MAKLSISAAIAASLTFGAFGFNQMYGEDSKPAPKQVEQNDNRSIQTGKQWTQALLDLDINGIIKNTQAPFLLDAKDSLDDLDKVRAIYEQIIEKKGGNFANIQITKAAECSAERSQKVLALITKRGKGLLSVPARTKFIEVTLGTKDGSKMGDNSIIVFIDPKTNKCLGFTDF